MTFRMRISQVTQRLSKVSGRLAEVSRYFVISRKITNKILTLINLAEAFFLSRWFTGPCVLMKHDNYHVQKSPSCTGSAGCFWPDCGDVDQDVYTEVQASGIWRAAMTDVIGGGEGPEGRYAGWGGGGGQSRTPRRSWGGGPYSIVIPLTSCISMKRC